MVEGAGVRGLGRVSLADPAAIAEVWRQVAVPMFTYLAACDWRAPLDPRAAGEWLFDESRVSFLHRFDQGPVIASLQRYRWSHVGRMVVLSADGADFDPIDLVVDHLARLALDDFGLRRLEWWVPSRWERALAAAAAVGFAEEARLPEAWFVEGRYEDLVVHGLLAGERRGL